MLKTILLPVNACLLLFAEDPAWKNKSMATWSVEDAKQVLSDSPWAQSVKPQWVRDLSPDERRASGDLEADRGNGVGLDGLIGIFDPAREAEAVERAHAKPDPGTVLVRWESARPVRTAEQTSPDREASTVDSDVYYVIVVYDIIIPKGWNERVLKGVAALKRRQKKDLKPARVEVLRKARDRATIVYEFSRSVEITKRDGAVVFQAQVGRLVVTRVFSIAEMQVQDQLEL